MEKSATSGKNRTGIDFSPIDSRDMQKASDTYPPTQASGATIESIKRSYIQESERLGSVPVPDTLKGAFKTLTEKLTGNQPAVFINKLGERLAYERSGVRIYESLIVKCSVANETGELGFDLPVPKLRQFRNEEQEHFLMLVECMEKIGADPTAQTPDADVSGVASSGFMKVITDPRTTPGQCLEALLAIELTDNAAWELLIQLALDMGEKDIATRFQKAHSQEQVHLREVRELYEKVIRAQATGGKSMH